MFPLDYKIQIYPFYFLTYKPSMTLHYLQNGVSKCFSEAHKALHILLPNYVLTLTPGITYFDIFLNQQTLRSMYYSSSHSMFHIEHSFSLWSHSLSFPLDESLLICIFSTAHPAPSPDKHKIYLSYSYIPTICF